MPANAVPAVKNGASNAGGTRVRVRLRSQGLATRVRVAESRRRRAVALCRVVAVAPHCQRRDGMDFALLLRTNLRMSARCSSGMNFDMAVSVLACLSSKARHIPRQARMYDRSPPAKS
nr:hypothetical protein CFP56_31643 [Quercus suber]